LNDLSDRIFWVAKDEEIKGGAVTDFYFLNTEQALKMREMNPMVTMEVYTRHLPYDGEWGVVTGIYEVAKLLEGLPVADRVLQTTYKLIHARPGCHQLFTQRLHFLRLRGFLGPRGALRWRGRGVRRHGR